MQYIYKITNIKNNKVYIGLTNDLRRREREHFNGSKLKCYIDKEIFKSPEDFVFEKIEEVETREEVEQRKKS